MRIVQVLVYYASVVWHTKTVVEYEGDGLDPSFLHSECLGKPPLYHRRFSITVKRRRCCWLVDGPFTYCAVVDEALGKEVAFRFLEHVKQQFQQLLDKKGLVAVGEDLTLFSLKEDFLPIIRHLVLPLVGTPMEDLDITEETPPEHEVPEIEPTEDTTSLEAPLYTRRVADQHSGKAGCSCLPLTRVNSFKNDKRMSKEACNESKQNNLDNHGRTMERTQKLETLFEDLEQNTPMQKSSSMRSREQFPHRTWWRKGTL
ncbi:hypothetical protein O6H91_08G031900 [Diphasiastrum complanatum]|uniref:Uncharacterized protein n=1 Tax=Diphasiastrum complanatum TaxID=34168 RepID=A0ACC2CW87_DIPCM|nr:hypothetical protein O6H91_08G031900 [Diphasiastrum complanatum]